MAWPPQFLDELIDRTDLVDLVGESVRLTKKGNSYWGCCPFHSEKTPSFHVVPDRKIYKCFGCGKGGGAINFVMELDNLSFREAVEVLAKRCGMQVPDSGASPGAKERREKLLTINKQAARAFHRWLYAPEGAQGLAYLQKRGLSKGTLTRFGLGFAPNRWDALIQELSKEGYDKRDLLDAGLAVSNKDGRIYDRFRNRVMFPIIDTGGNVIGFGGRVMDDSTPKYLNSPDTPVYNKSRNVFALNIAKKGRAPVYHQDDRMAIIAGLACVDGVFLEESLEQKAEYLRGYGADILVMGDDWAGKFDDFSCVCEVVYFPRTPSVSTTGIIEVIRGKSATY